MSTMLDGLLGADLQGKIARELEIMKNAATTGSMDTLAEVHEDEQWENLAPSPQPRLPRVDEPDDIEVELLGGRDPSAPGREAWKNWQALSPQVQKALVRAHGVPETLRMKVWPHLLRVQALQKSSKSYPALQRVQLDAADAQVLAVDIPRTFPEIDRFQEQVVADQLTRMCYALSVARKEGYCQGLNFVAGTFLVLLGYAEEISFWCCLAM